MSKFTLYPISSSQEVWICLMKDVENATELCESVIKGDFPAALINPELIMGAPQLLQAATKAFLRECNGSLKTRSLYSELLYYLSPTNQINTSIQNFGINQNSKQIIVLVIGSQSEFNNAIGKIRGKRSELESTFVEEKVRKVFGIPEESKGDLMRTAMCLCASMVLK